MRTFIIIVLIGAAAGLGSTGFFAGAMWEQYTAQKIALADGCARIDYKTLEFQRLHVPDGVLLEQVYEEQIGKTNALKDEKKKGGKK